MATNKLDELSINTIRFLAVDGVEKACSGHPGMPMGDAAMAYTLWTKHLRYNPKNPKWPGRDRFVLSAGHGSMLLYSLLHLTGYDLSLDDLKNFRQWGARTPGHPEYDLDMGVEMTTGPLGQGFATGVGMAMAERYLAGRYNKDGYQVFDYNIYAIAGDGDMMEGITNEAASLAGHLGLGRLIYLYSDNKITIEGSTDIAFTEDVGARFEALDWHVQKIDGMDVEAVSAAIEAAKAKEAAIRGCRWATPPWHILSGQSISDITQKTPSGRDATASCFRRGTALCCSIRSCILRVTIFRLTISKTSGSGERALRAIQSTTLTWVSR